MELAEVRIPGSLLTALIYQASGKTNADEEGLLLGREHRVSRVVTEDSREATVKYALETDISAYVDTGRRQSFYDASAQVSVDKVQAQLKDINPAHEVVGWYVIRRKVPPRPSVRDAAVLRSLGSCAAGIKRRRAGSTGAEETKGSTATASRHPMVLLILSVDLRPYHHIQTFDYACYSLPSQSLGRLIPLPVKILSLTHDSQAEYRKQPSSFYSPLQLSVASSGAEAMSEELRLSLRAQAPPPHAKLLEDHVNSIVSRVRAVIEELRSEEAEVHALEERRDQLLQQLVEEGPGVNEGQAAAQTEASEPGVALAREQLGTEGTRVEAEGGEGSMDDVILVEGAYVNPPGDSPRQDDTPSDPQL